MPSSASSLGAILQASFCKLHLLLLWLVFQCSKPIQLLRWLRCRRDDLYYCRVGFAVVEITYTIVEMAYTVVELAYTIVEMASLLSRWLILLSRWFRCCRDDLYGRKVGFAIVEMAYTVVEMTYTIVEMTYTVVKLSF